DARAGEGDGVPAGAQPPPYVDQRSAVARHAGYPRGRRAACQRRGSDILRGPRLSMPFEKTATRLWKRLTREERLTAASAFWHEPPQEVAGSALAAIVKARHLRPQVARALDEEEKARSLASVLDPGETVASALLVALHLGERRPILAAFLDAAGLPHENGVLKEEDS